MLFYGMVNSRIAPPKANFRTVSETGRKRHDPAIAGLGIARHAPAIVGLDPRGRSAEAEIDGEAGTDVEPRRTLLRAAPHTAAQRHAAKIEPRDLALGHESAIGKRSGEVAADIAGLASA